MTKILVIGSLGQLGTELVTGLQEEYGKDNVIASDLKPASEVSGDFIYEQLDVMNKDLLLGIVEKYRINHIYHLAAILSAKGEQNPQWAWDLNMGSLFNILDLAKDIDHVNRIYWPSSIAVFGPDTPKVNTPQQIVTNPTTVYGISKLAGERWCQYYFEKYGVDVRSIRYPGLIGYKSLPGGGTTDYAVDIYYKALENEKFDCFLSENTALPMMYMPDAVRATIDIMKADPEKIKIRSSYNLSAFSFTPEEIYQSIKKFKPDFEIEYTPDFRQKIADSWPDSIDDSCARNDWGWKPEYNLDSMTEDILINLEKLLESQK
ncbi:NAD-dependent epimerase/dehydratase family protein [Marinigracilibium pacificum]|uniref:NAD-dependent epimerase/dehydratase family protein n=1 Tax=Marinigracilibium pacificum TaxID=2729599 RepID=A0A848IZW0_9BACT|nr:NAD-dependent epimerase/dehydratase family protein [Marinigracilibium pacificum]NMM48815.1 NAD-dependent epimerase/dehydratase family protein [Marinigracilibium pacificum]